MRWEDERYVRLYTRDTPEFLALSWQARGLFALILRKVDRAGVLAVGRLGLKGVAVAVGGPWSEIEGPLNELLEDGCIFFDSESSIVGVKNFLAAQECPRSDRARQRASREKAAATLRASQAAAVAARKALDVTNRDELASQNVTECHAPSHDVTRGHAVSHAVTPCLAEPSRAETNQTKGVQGGDEAVEEDPEPPESVAAEAAPSVVSDVASELWEFYVSELRRIRERRRPTKLADKDRRTIRRLVADGMTLGELKRAVVGLFLSSFHLGQNDRGTEYLELKYALREPQRFIALADAQAPPPQPVASGPPSEAAPVDPAQVAMLLDDLSLNRRKSA